MANSNPPDNIQDAHELKKQERLQREHEEDIRDNTLSIASRPGCRNPRYPDLNEDCSPFTKSSYVNAQMKSRGISKKKSVALFEDEITRGTIIFYKNEDRVIGRGFARRKVSMRLYINKYRF